MQIVFTICSNNYLASARVLYDSVKKNCTNVRFYLFLCDEKQENLPYNIFADEVILLKDIEEEFYAFAGRYNIVELNTSLKPRAFQFLFEQFPDASIMYLDPDICIFHSLEIVFKELSDAAMLVTPHILTPIPFDGRMPSENHFLNFGIFNLGFLALKLNRETNRMLEWWKGHTYRQCYIDVYKGIFVDQLPMNHLPVFFEGVKILKWPVLNMAPWNLHERRATLFDGRPFVNGEPLIFFHFSSFKPGNLRLPLEQYNRFKLEDRPELRALYLAYEKRLLEAGYANYATIPYSFAELRKKYLKEKKKEKLKIKMDKWLRK